jgi:hypothetical protein
LNIFINMDTIRDVKDFFFDQLYAPEHVRKEKCRVLERLAKEFLLRNETIVINGKVRWFGIRRIGLGVCEIFLNDRQTTCMYE